MRQTVRFDAGQRATFIFVFSGSCDICNRELPQWKEMLAALDSRRIRTVFVSAGASCHIICQTDDDCAGQFAQCVFCRPPLEGQGWLCTATNQ